MSNVTYTKIVSMPAKTARQFLEFCLQDAPRWMDVLVVNFEKQNGAVTSKSTCKDPACAAATLQLSERLDQAEHIQKQLVDQLAEQKALDISKIRSGSRVRWRKESRYVACFGPFWLIFDYDTGRIVNGDFGWFLSRRAMIRYMQKNGYKNA